MSGSISFSTIPADLRVPLWAEFDNSRAGPSTTTQRALLIGAKTTAARRLTSPLCRLRSRWRRPTALDRRSRA